MRLVLVIFGCSLCSLAAAAPQDNPTNSYNENAIIEESTDSISEVSTEELTSSTGAPTSLSTSKPVLQESGSTIYKQVSTSAPDVATHYEVYEETDQEPTSSVKPPPETIATAKPVVTAVATTTKKPRRKTTVKPLVESPVVAPSPTTPAPARRYPCRCSDGMCSCCTGLILENFNVPIRSRACANVTYEPEDFAFKFNLLYNNRVLYNTRMSAKNPRPACIPINRFFGIKMCVRLSNVYMSGRNVHACLDMEGYWDDESAFQYSFNCFRVGSNGIAVVRPEDGGGLPPPPDGEEQTDEDYDDSARGWTGDVEVVQN